MMKYRFTGAVDEEFPSLSGVLVFEQGRANATLEPGDSIEVPDPVVHPRLEPADDETRTATERHYDRPPPVTLTDAEESALRPGPEAAEGPNPSPRRRTKPDQAAPVPDTGKHADTTPQEV